MDLAELGIVFLAEGADAAIEKMDAFTEASDRAEQSEKRRLQAAVNFARTEEQRNVALANQAEYMSNVAEAAAKNAAAQDRLEERIGRAAVAMLGSKSAMLEYEAALIGASDRFADVIGKLREMEEAVSAEAAAEKAHQQAMREEQGYLLDLAKDIEHLNKVRAKEAADAEAARQKELASRQAYYDGIIKAAKDAENAERDARHKAILDAQDATAKAVALYTEEENQKKKAAEKAAAETAAINKKAADDAIKEAERKTISEIQWAQKSRDEQIRIKEQIAAYKGAGVGDETLSKMFGSGALKGAVKDVESFGEAMEKVGWHTSRARSEAIVLAHEIVQGRFSRIPASLMVFAEYTDLAAVAMTGVGLAAMGAAAVVAVLTLAAAKGSLEWDNYAKALSVTGNFAGMTTQDFQGMASAMTDVHGKIGEAKDILLELAGSGRFTKEQMQTIAPAILEMSEVGGVAVKTLIAEYTKIQDDPVKAAIELNKHYHFLTEEVYVQIRALQEQGDKQAAAALVDKTLAAEQNERMETLRAKLGTIQQAWLWIGQTASKSWDIMKGIGAPETDIEKVEKLYQRLAKIRAENANPGLFSNPDSATEQQIIDQIFAIQMEGAEKQRKAAHDSEVKLAEQEAIDARARLDATLDHVRSNGDKRNEAMAKVYQDADKINTKHLVANSKFNDDIRNQLEEINSRPIPIMRDNTAAYLEAVKAKSAKVNQLLKDSGIELEFTEKNTQEALLAAAEKYHDKKIAGAKNASFVELTEIIRVQNEEANISAKHADRMIADSQRGFENSKQIQADELAILRSNAKSKEGIGFLEADQYAKYVERMRALAQEALDVQLDQIAKERQAKADSTEVIIRAIDAQIAYTQHDVDEKKRLMALALESNKAFQAKMDDLEQIAKDRAANSVAKVEADTYKMMNADMNAVIGTLEKKLDKEKAHLQTLQLSKEAIALLAAKEEERITTVLEGEQQVLEAKKEAVNGDTKLVRIYQDQIDKIKNIIKLRKQLKDTNDEIGIAQREYDRIKAVEEAWKHSWDQTNKTAQEVFVTWVEGGENMAKKIGDMLKKSLLQAIYDVEIKPIVLQLYMSIMGNGGSAGQKVLDSMGLTGDGTGAIGALNGASSLNTLYGAGKQLFFGTTSGASGASLAYANGVGMVGGDSMGALISANGGWAGVSTAASAGATEGALVGTKAALYSELGYTGAAAGTAATGSAVGGTAAGASSGSLMGMSYTGWGIIVAAILSQLGGPQIDRVGGGLQGSIGGSGGSNLSAYNVYKEDHHGLFGIGAFTTENREYGAANAEVTKFINEQIKTITDSAKKYGEALGVPVEKIDGFTKQIDVNLTNLDAAGVQKALQDAINGFANDLTNSAFGDAMAQFAKAGESTGTTLMRVNAEVGTVNATLAKLGGQLFNLDAAGIKAADGLVQAMGGLEAFQQQTASYYQNYYTQEEQRQMQAQDIAAKLAASGITVSVEQVLSGTREQFRALVESFTANGGLLTESGQKAVAALMSVADAFASITVAANTATTPGSTGTTGTTPTDRWDWWNDPIKAAEHDRAVTGGGGGGGGVSDAVNKALQERTQLQQELDNLTLTSAELLKKQRDALDESNRALFDQVQVAKAAKAAADERKDLQDQYNQLTLTELQLRALERDSIALSNRDLYDRITAIKSAQKELDAAKTGVSNAMSSLQRAVDAEKQSIEAARRAAQERANILGSIVSTLGDAVGGIRGNVESTKAAAAARGNAFITDALATAKVSGYMPDADALKKAISDARAGLDVNNYTSQFEYEKAQLELAGKLDGLKEIADPQLTAAKQAVKVAEDQLKALDAQLKLAQDQIDALNGIDTSVKSVAEAMTALTAAINAQRAAQDHLTGLTGGGGGGTTATTSWTGEKTGTLTNSFWQMWGDTMQREYGENAGYKVYDMAKSQGITLADLDKAMGWTDGHAKAWALAHGLPAFAVGTNYVPRDMVAQIHEGEAIVPKVYNPAAGGASGNARLESLVEALTAEVQRLQAIANDGNRHAQRTANAVNGNPEVPMLVTTV